MQTPVSRRSRAMLDAMVPFSRYFAESAWSRRDPGDPEVCDFVFGNPHEMPIEAYVEALREHARPRNKDWYAYKLSEPSSRRIVAESLRERRGLPFEPEDVFMTNGAFAALSVALCALVDPGDEVVFVSPPWFFYESIIVAYGATPVRARIDATTLDLDLDSVAAALSDRTRAVIVNSPHNPTGRIYPAATLDRLARLLEEAGERAGRTIYLFSDEAYSRIIFDGREYPSPVAHYPASLLIYTYGKTLLTPGQRIGYIALAPTMPERPSLRAAIEAAQFVTGFAFPNALLQHSLASLEELSIDIGHLQLKRDRMVRELSDMGYAVNIPEGTFYLMVRSPVPDDVAFVDSLAAHKVHVLPGSVVEMPGTFRLSLTANDEMLERSLRGFRTALDEVAARA